MRNFSHKSCGENQNTFVFKNIFLPKSCRLWDIVEKCGTAREATNNVTIWRICLTCWISKATRAHAHVHARASGACTHAHTQICNIYCFPSATMIHERASMLRSMYKVVQIWPGRSVCKQVTVCPGHIWTTLYIAWLVSFPFMPFVLLECNDTSSSLHISTVH